MPREANGAEEALMRGEQELRLLVEAIPTLVWRAAPEGNIEYVNKRVLEYLGAPLDEVIGWGWMDKIHPDDVAFKVRTWLQNLEYIKPHHAVCRFRGADGRYRWFEVRGEPLRASDGTVRSWYGVLIDIDERRKAEEELRESEYKLSQVIETVPSLIWSTDPAGEPTQLNQRIFDYSGMRLEDFKHGGWEAFIHPDDFPETIRAFSHAIQTGTSYQTVHRLRRADGEFRWHHARGEPLRDEEGRIIRWYGLAVDIDEAKKAEESLRRSEAHLAEAQRLSHTGAVAYNGTAILFASEETYHIWGFDPAQGLPSREVVFQRIHPDDRDWLNAEVRRAVGEKRRYSIGYRILLPDGTVKHLETVGQPVFSANGKLVEIFATQTDVTGRKRAEEALRESEQRFRDYAEAASDWYWETNPDHKFIRVTDYERLVALGFSPVSRIGLTRWDYATDVESEPEKWELHRSLLEARQPFRDFVYRAARSNGSPVFYKTSGKPIYDAKGAFLGYRGTAADVTATMRAQEEHERLLRLESDLAHMNRLSIMGELAASLAHEITQPIAAARNNARAALNFLDRQPSHLAEVREALTSVVGDADRAGVIVDRIRDHIKKAPPRKHRFDLNEAINEVIVLAQGTMAENRVSVRTLLAEGPVPAEGDRVQLQQVILNLILNAAEAMSAVEGARELLISTEQSRTNGVLVTVRDSGPGIDPKHTERIFDAFYTTKSNGVGMGLSICRSIIDSHGGRLWAEANADRGAAFRFTLTSPERNA